MFIDTGSDEKVMITNSYVSGNHALNGGAFCKLSFRLFPLLVRISGHGVPSNYFGKQIENLFSHFLLVPSHNRTKQIVDITGESMVHIEEAEAKENG